ncbi:hypothetical protein DPMN_005201 [Dreissena polymorpha]|uniref:Uncharacterized protein n=1 Tax=Dreissena polymorpha TaxID=45954 RepID=A0A9D4MT18_DREPO|nr:hypothetical protein DPMN_005201 [Dreissena polymorpha]
MFSWLVLRLRGLPKRVSKRKSRSNDPSGTENPGQDLDGNQDDEHVNKRAVRWSFLL